MTDGSILFELATEQQSVDRIDLAQLRDGWWLLETVMNVTCALRYGTYCILNYNSDSSLPEALHSFPSVPLPEGRADTVWKPAEQ